MGLILGIVAALILAFVLNLVFAGWFDLGPLLALGLIALAIAMIVSGYLLFLIIIGGLIAVGSVVSSFLST